MPSLTAFGGGRTIARAVCGRTVMHSATERCHETVSSIAVVEIAGLLRRVSSTAIATLFRDGAEAMT